jgi:hypothetical protein
MLAAWETAIAVPTYLEEAANWARSLTNHLTTRGSILVRRSDGALQLGADAKC